MLRCCIHYQQSDMLIIKSAPDGTPLKAVRFGSPASGGAEFLYKAVLTKDDAYLYAIGMQSGALKCTCLHTDSKSRGER